MNRRSICSWGRISTASFVAWSLIAAPGAGSEGSTVLTTTVELGGYIVADSATIVAKVTKDGKPLAGVLVWFNMEEGPHYGQFPYTTAITGSDGTARATIQGDGLLGVDRILVGTPAAVGEGPVGSQEPTSAEWQEFSDRMNWRTHIPGIDNALGCNSSAVQGLAQAHLPPTPPDGTLSNMRRVRDDVLSRNPLGQEYVGLYYQYSPHITRIIIDHPTLLPRVYEMMRRYSSRLAQLADVGVASFTQSEIDEIDDLAGVISVHADPALRDALAKARRDLADPDVQRLFGIRVE